MTRYKHLTLLALLFAATSFHTLAQKAPAVQPAGLTDTSRSTHSVLSNLPLGATRWTDGFWGDRFKVFSETSVQSMWQTWNTPSISHGFRNFEIAAGDSVPADDHEHWGPPFHDGDMYKWLESVAAVYSVTRDPELDRLMDYFIDRVVRAQREDGYIHTPVIIDEMNRGIDSHAVKKQQTIIGTAVGGEDEKGAFANRLNFETYNLGHLMMAAIVHRRATGKTTLFDCAVRATEFLVHFYETASAELARCAICPSHYMGVVEMWRETGNPRYLELAQQLIQIRSLVKNGTDDNQDRYPFEEQYEAMGHAVRSTYLYAGVADIIAETGNEQYMRNLTSIWQDLTYRKMYITGGCGALYDGTSPDGTNYTPDSIQKVHQSFGRPYQLPNSTAHNETCAQIGNMLFNWRMNEITGEAKYVDVAELCMLNSILSGISLDGRRYFYTNPLRISADLPYTLRWPKERKEYISCFCCPPNTLRTVAEAQNYAFSVSAPSQAPSLTLQFYGASTTRALIPGIGEVSLTEVTNYPWDGKVRVTIDALPRKARNKEWTLRLRIPDWCDRATLHINGVPYQVLHRSSTYAEVTRVWAKGDVVEWEMSMPVRLMEANPLVEEVRNQVAVKRGPIVYCLESADLPKGVKIDDVIIPADIRFTPVMTQIDGHPVMSLEGVANVAQEASWQGQLYREVGASGLQIPITLIPYYAWGNRGKGEMTVWMPLQR